MPSGFSPRSPSAASPRGQFKDFQRQPKPLYERTSGDSNVSTTSALDIDAFGVSSLGRSGGTGTDIFAATGAFGAADTRRSAVQWVSTTPRGLDARSMSSMYFSESPVADHGIHGSHWHQANVGNLVPQPESGPLDHRRASAWHDINASFVV